jgi:hypothetical protein
LLVVGVAAFVGVVTVAVVIEFVAFAVVAFVVVLCCVLVAGLPDASASAFGVVAVALN